jgi:hypothetical protein
MAETKAIAIVKNPYALLTGIFDLLPPELRLQVYEDQFIFKTTTVRKVSYRRVGGIHNPLYPSNNMLDCVAINVISKVQVELVDALGSFGCSLVGYGEQDGKRQDGNQGFSGVDQDPWSEFEFLALFWGKTPNVGVQADGAPGFGGLRQ